MSEKLNFWQMQEQTQSQIIDNSLTVGGAFQCIKQFVNDKLENDGQGLEESVVLIEQTLSEYIENSLSDPSEYKEEISAINNAWKVVRKCNCQSLEDYEKLLIEKSLVKIQKEVINEKN